MNLANAAPMNKGYRLLFWSAFFLFLLGEQTGDSVFSLWRLIGVCLAVSGTGVLYIASGSRRFYRARLWALAGGALMLLEFCLSLLMGLALEGEIVWEIRFLFYGAWAVVFLQIFMNVLAGGAELLGSRGPANLSKWGAAFALTYTLLELAVMAKEFLGSEMLGLAAGSWAALFLALALAPGILVMRLMALLRRNYFPG